MITWNEKIKQLCCFSSLCTHSLLLKQILLQLSIKPFNTLKWNWLFCHTINPQTAQCQTKAIYLWRQSSNACILHVYLFFIYLLWDRWGIWLFKTCFKWTGMFVFFYYAVFCLFKSKHTDSSTAILPVVLHSK